MLLVFRYTFMLYNKVYVQSFGVCFPLSPSKCFVAATFCNPGFLLKGAETPGSPRNHVTIHPVGVYRILHPHKGSRCHIPSANLLELVPGLERKYLDNIVLNPLETNYSALTMDLRTFLWIEMDRTC